MAIDVKKGVGVWAPSASCWKPGSLFVSVEERSVAAGERKNDTNCHSDVGSDEFSGGFCAVLMLTMVMCTALQSIFPLCSVLLLVVTCCVNYKLALAVQ